MHQFTQLVPIGSEPEDAIAAIQDNPELAAAFARIGQDSAWKAKTRAKLLSRYGTEVANAVLPPKEAGRPARGAKGPWALVSRPVEQRIAARLGLALPLSEDPAAWTPELARRASNEVVAHYPNLASATVGLTKLRMAFRAMRAPKDLEEATYHPDITLKVNEASAKRRDERIAAGIDVPPPFARIADLQERVAAFVAAPAATAPAAQDAADFLVTFSARPGEAETLELGPKGGVIGALKKRGVLDAYPIVSAVGREAAEAFLKAWKARPQASRARAMAELPQLARSWGLQVRDLRAIGASLAVRAALLAGEASTTGLAREVHRGALRHGESKMAEGKEPQAARLPPQAHYDRVRDDVAQLAAQLAEMSVEEVQAIRNCVAERLAARPL